MKKVVIPDDKEQIKIFGFLDEEVCKRLFSWNIYIANSKRKVSCSYLWAHNCVFQYFNGWIKIEKMSKVEKFLVC